MGGLAGVASFGRNNNAGTQATGVNQTASMRISDIRSNYNYPNWFDTTMGYFRDGKISSQAFESAYANLAKQGLITLKTGGTPATTGGFSKSQIEQIMIDYYGDDIKRLDRIHGEQEKRITAAKRPKSEVEQILIDYYGDDIKRLDAGHANQEDRISSHTHANTTTPPNECEWWNIFCKMQTQIDEGFQGLGKLALIGGLAVVGIFLLKMRLGK